MAAGSFEFLLRKIPNDYSYKKSYLDKHSNNIKILFLGNSHVYYDVDPQYIQSNSFNAAHISQSLNYDFEILKKYDSKFDSLRFIFVSVDYFSLFTKLETSVEAWRIKNYHIYYNIYSSFSIKNNLEILNYKFANNLKRLYAYYFNGTSDINCTDLGWGTNYNSKNDKNLIETGMIAAKRHTIKSDLLLNENLDILKSIIRLAGEKNVKVVLFSFPAYRSYVENLDTNQLNRTITSLSMLANAYPNTRYYNLLNDKSFGEMDFFDADHLNEIGAKKLSLKINDIIKE
jgi:hypothetical protein